MAGETSAAVGEGGKGKLPELGELRGEGTREEDAKIARIIKGTGKRVRSDLGIVETKREEAKAKRGGRSEESTGGKGAGKAKTQAGKASQEGIEGRKVRIGERG